MNTCEKCQRNNHKLQKAFEVLHPIPVQPKVWHQVGMGIIGPTPETPRVTNSLLPSLIISLNGLRLRHFLTRLLWVLQNSFTL